MPFPQLQAKQQQIAQHWRATHGASLPLSELALLVLASSDFVYQWLLKYPAWLADLQQSPPNEQEQQRYLPELIARLQGVANEADCLQQLRLYRQQMLVRIAWGQISYCCSTTQTLAQLSALADALLMVTRDWFYQQCCQQWGTPVDEQGNAQPLLILAMGKLGGQELNFSSDIDLIFYYPLAGKTHGQTRVLDNQQFFTRLAQKIINALTQATELGWVYRVDMRLRPQGSAGPLVLSFTALVEYYQTQGRDWERYALLKARLLPVVSGLIENATMENTPYQTAWLALQRAFVYRRYIDYTVLQSLRDIKLKIAQQARHLAAQYPIKLGNGGIRAMEFIVQAQQLLRGGKESRLRQSSFLAALSALSTLSLLPLAQITQLRDSYLFMRRLENLLQSMADQQCYFLPDDLLTQQRLAVCFGYLSWDELFNDYQRHTAAVHQLFIDIIGESPVKQPSLAVAVHYQWLWQQITEPQQNVAMSTVGVNTVDWPVLNRQLTAFHQDLLKRPLSQYSEQIIDQLIPVLLAQLVGQQQAEATLARVLQIFIKIANRPTYLQLFIEYPIALVRLVNLCLTSAMLAEQIAQYPLLLDELLRTKASDGLTELDHYPQALQQFLLSCDEDDQEQWLETLHHFKQIQLFNIAVAEINGELTLMKVSDHLTYLAQALIDLLIATVWRQLVAKYGELTTITGEKITPQQSFAVLAYGKLGGLELSYSSDLDLVFIYQAPFNASTAGTNSLSGQHFFLRVVQKLIHLMTSKTVTGILYAIDTRLRPSGSAGLLVSSWPAFAQYQAEQAWLWEHQALVRGRMIYGCSSLQQAFGQLRQQVLQQQRDEPALKQQIISMREKMRQHRAPTIGQFDIKQDAGGVIDIEFIVQYLLLRYAADYPALIQWSDNYRQLTALASQGLITPEQAQQLSACYLAFRQIIHRRTLQNLTSQLDEQQLDAVVLSQRQYVLQQWQYYFASSE